MIARPRGTIVNGVPDGSMVESCIREHLLGLNRLEKLRAYFDGRHAIDGRIRAAGMPNLHMTHAFPRYISTMASGYLIGNPVRYECGDEAEELENVLAEYQRCAVDSIDAELARAASIYGKGVELVYADESARPCSTALDPRDAFVVYEDSVEQKPMMGVYLLPWRTGEGRLMGYFVYVCTDSRILRYRVKSLCDVKLGSPEQVQEHFFGHVPMIEYWNGEDEKGDFEDVISLIDAYDLLQSDRMNDKQQFVDALLILYGCSLQTDERGRSPGQQLREDKALSLPDTDARAEWLCKQLSEADTEVLKNAIKADIHKMSLVPDLTDEHFAGNSSGVAMRYKLLGLEQLTRIKERWFREALRTRLMLYCRFLTCRGVGAPESANVRMIFTRSLPVNELETAQTLSTLREILPEEELERRAMAMDGRI